LGTPPRVFWKIPTGMVAAYLRKKSKYLNNFLGPECLPLLEEKPLKKDIINC